jgi:hypothetical protein
MSEGDASIIDRFLRDLGVPATAIPVRLDERASLYRSLLAARHIPAPSGSPEG